MFIKCLLVVFLAGTAVRCDDDSKNYYVIEMPEETSVTKAQSEKTFEVFWNVPTKQCKSKRIPFTNLFDKYGIIQNTNDSFRGDKVAILYDPGLFPALLKNETSGQLKFRNGGVPQQGNLKEHLDSFKSTMEQSIPDADFDGIGIIDFESWRPVFRQNFGVLTPYKNISYNIERKNHWWWPKTWIQNEAKQRYEAAGKVFMKSTVSLAKQLRPKARWGYYGFPYCFNMASNNMKESCAANVPQENNQISWLWSESSALYPSVYSPKSLTSKQLAGLIRGRITEAARVRQNSSPILPYFWFRYRDGGFLSETDLQTALKTMYLSKASGFIIWGSSSDVNTVAKCNKLLSYVENTLGPAIAKYVKSVPKFDDETITDSATYSTGAVTTEVTYTDQYSTTDISTTLGSTTDQTTQLNEETVYSLSIYSQTIAVDATEQVTNTDQYNNTIKYLLDITSTTLQPTQTNAITSESETFNTQADRDGAYDQITSNDSNSGTGGDSSNVSSTTNQPTWTSLGTSNSFKSQTGNNETNVQITNTDQYTDKIDVALNPTSVTDQPTQDNTGTDGTESLNNQTDSIEINSQYVTFNTDYQTTQGVTETKQITTPSGEDLTSSLKETNFIDILINALSHSKSTAEEKNSSYFTTTPSIFKDLISTSTYESTINVSTSSPIFDKTGEPIGDLTLADILLNSTYQNINTMQETTPSLMDNETTNQYMTLSSEISNMSSANEYTSSGLSEGTNVNTEFNSTGAISTIELQRIGGTTDYATQITTENYGMDPNVNVTTTEITKADLNNITKAVVTNYYEIESSYNVNIGTKHLESSTHSVSTTLESITDTSSSDTTKSSTTTAINDLDYIVVNEEGRSEEDSSLQPKDNQTMSTVMGSSTDDSSSKSDDVKDFSTFEIQGDTTSHSETEETTEGGPLSILSTSSPDKVVVYVL